jgi:hypothetical protein
VTVSVQLSAVGFQQKQKTILVEPLAKCPGIIREKSLATAHMETPGNDAVNFWQFGCKIKVFPEFWT